MKLTLLHEGVASDIGHVGLDLAGFIPGAGELADATNALWYIKEKKYVSAAFSLISMIPEVGDVAAKGIKYLGKGSTIFGKFIAKYGDDIHRAWSNVKTLVMKSEKFRDTIGKNGISKMDHAIRKILEDSKKLEKENDKI